jgi:hypothetical protein
LYRFSKYISTILHPVLLPTIATLVYFILVPTYHPLKQIYIIVCLVFLGSYIIPLLLLVLFKSLKLISNYEIEDVKERRLPVISFLVLSFILGKIFFSLPQFKLLSLLFFASFMSLSFVYLLLHLNFKTSLHLTGISGFTAYIILISLIYKLNLIYLIALLLLLTGLLATARLILKAHSPTELIAGFSAGIGSIILTTYFLY